MSPGTDKMACAYTILAHYVTVTMTPAVASLTSTSKAPVRIVNARGVASHREKSLAVSVSVVSLSSPGLISCNFTNPLRGSHSLGQASSAFWTPCLRIMAYLCRGIFENQSQIHYQYE